MGCTEKKSVQFFGSLCIHNYHSWDSSGFVGINPLAYTDTCQAF